MVVFYTEAGTGTGRRCETTFVNYETTNHREGLNPLVARKMRELNVREEMLKTKIRNLVLYIILN